MHGTMNVKNHLPFFKILSFKPRVSGGVIFSLCIIIIIIISLSFEPVYAL
jgi:hypothetical protein